MSPRPIRQVPDPVLRGICAPVTAFDAGLRDLVADMFDTMYAAPGRGLAAPQVGVGLRLFIMDTTWKTGTPTPQVFVNPAVTSQAADHATLEEACLSIPGQTVLVSRPAWVALRWQDETGAAQAGRFDGFAAVCVQHESDHLDGVLCTDYAGGAT